MKTAPLVAFLIFGGAIAFVLWDAQRRKPRVTTDTTVTQNPATTQVDSLQRSIDDLSGQVTTLAGDVGKLAGGSAGAAGGHAVSSAEQEIAKGLGAHPLTDQQIYDLSHNAAQNGLVLGTTAGANVASAAGGASGAGPFDFIAGFFSGAASSELLRRGGVADKLQLPKWGG